MYATYSTEFIFYNHEYIKYAKKYKYVHDSLEQLFDMKMTLLMNIVCYNL